MCEYLIRRGVLKVRENMQPDTPVDRSDLMRLAFLFEGGLVVLAVIFGWLTDTRPFGHLEVTASDAAIGVLTTLPMLLSFVWMYRSRLTAFQRIREFLIETLGPTLAQTRWFDVIVLALLAGFCEELFFRGFLQVWLSQWGVWVGLIGSSFIFGIVHAVTPTYFMLTFVAGLYLGGVFLQCDSNLLAPMIAHALYDYVAFLVIVAAARAHVDQGDQVPN